MTKADRPAAYNDTSQRLQWIVTECRQIVWLESCGLSLR